MSIGSVSSARPVSSLSAETSSPQTVPANLAPASADLGSQAVNPVTQEPAALRFPWLSRLTAELEPVATQKPTFPTPPSLGENLDQSA